MIITGTQFLTEVRALGFECWTPRDRQVFCPEESWLKEFGKFTLENWVSGADEAWDCDDYALEAVVQASISCRKSSQTTGHSFVYCTVRLWGNLNGVDPNSQQISGHATNLVRLDTGVYVFFEPQNGRTCGAKAAISDGTSVPVNALL